MHPGVLGERCSAFRAVLLLSSGVAAFGCYLCQGKLPLLCKETRHELPQNKTCGSHQALTARGTGLAVYAEVCWQGCPGKSSVLGRTKFSSKQQELQVVAPGGAKRVNALTGVFKCSEVG